MAHAELDEEDPGLVVLRIEQWEGDRAKTIPGASWWESRGAWRVRLSWASCLAMRGVFGANLTVGPRLSDWSWEEWNLRRGPLASLRFQHDVPGMTGPTAERLWPLQRVAAYAMALAERYLELDQMGGGKTRTTLAAMKLAVALHGEAEVFPAFVACPNKVRRVWKQQALADVDGAGPFWPELRIEMLPKGKVNQRKLLERVEAGEVDVVAGNWEALKGLSRLEPFGNIEMTVAEAQPGPLNRIQWRTVVADEAHRMRDRRSKQTRALKAIAFGTPSEGTGPARFRFPLTGTFVGSNAAEAWSILNFADPEQFPAYSRFVDRYATNTWNPYGGLEIGGINPESREEFNRVLDPISIRRLREQFDPDKPRVLPLTLHVPMEAKQAKAYNDMAKDMLAALDGGTLAATNPMTRSGRLEQLAQAYGEMVDRGRRGPDGETLLDLQLAMPSNKVVAMLELVEESGIDPRDPAEGVPIVFGASSRQLIALCEAALTKAKIPYTSIVGGQSDEEQERQESAFEQGRTKVALCVIEAAKEGLNCLVAAPTLVFLQRSWDRIANEQFEARVDRPGQQHKSVSIIDVVSEGTTEEYAKLEKLGIKYDNFQTVVQDERILREMLAWRGSTEEASAA